MKPVEFKKLVTDHIPADRIVAITEFKVVSEGKTYKNIRITFSQKRDGWLSAAVTLDHWMGHTSINLQVNSGTAWSCLSVQDAAAIGQALLDAAYIAEEVNRVDH